MKATEVTAGLAESNGSLLPGLWGDSLHVTCGLTACTPGSVPGPTLGNEYGKTFSFFRRKIVVRYFVNQAQQACWQSDRRTDTFAGRVRPASTDYTLDGTDGWKDGHQSDALRCMTAYRYRRGERNSEKNANANGRVHHSNHYYLSYDNCELLR